MMTTMTTKVNVTFVYRPLSGDRAIAPAEWGAPVVTGATEEEAVPATASVADLGDAEPQV